jgi:hypothetical protein
VSRSGRCLTRAQLLSELKREFTEEFDPPTSHHPPSQQQQQQQQQGSAVVPTMARSPRPAHASPDEEEEEAGTAGGGRQRVEEDRDDLVFSLKEGGGSVVRGGTLEALVARLTYERARDARFQHAFLLTYRQFVGPLQLLERLRDRFLLPGPPPSEASEALRSALARRRQLVQLRVVAVLKHWLVEQPLDFAGPDAEPLRIALRQFLDIELPAHQLAEPARQLRQLLERVSATPPPPPPPLDPALKGAADAGTEVIGSWEEVPLQELALALTWRDAELFRRVEAREWLGQGWTKRDRPDLAPRLRALVASTNQLTEALIWDVVRQIPLRARTAALQRVMQLACLLRDLDNYNGLAACLACLHSAPVRRLTQAWQEVPPVLRERFEELARLMHYSSNYRQYRQVLRESRGPVVPYLAILLADATYIEEANPDLLPAPPPNLLNFQKRFLQARLIDEVRDLQRRLEAPRRELRALQPERRAALLAFLARQPARAEKEAYEQSLRVEPRNPQESVEALLMQEERLRERIHELELRLAQVEAENARLRQDQGRLDSELRAQIRLSMRQDKRRTARPIDPEVLLALSPGPAVPTAPTDHAEQRATRVLFPPRSALFTPAVSSAAGPRPARPPDTAAPAEQPARSSIKGPADPPADQPVRSAATAVTPVAPSQPQPRGNPRTVVSPPRSSSRESSSGRPISVSDTPPPLPPRPRSPEVQQAPPVRAGDGVASRLPAVTYPTPLPSAQSKRPFPMAVDSTRNPSPRLPPAQAASSSSPPVASGEPSSKGEQRPISPRRDGGGSPVGEITSTTSRSSRTGQARQKMRFVSSPLGEHLPKLPVQPIKITVSDQQPEPQTSPSAETVPSSLLPPSLSPPPPPPSPHATLQLLAPQLQSSTEIEISSPGHPASIRQSPERTHPPISISSSSTVTSDEPPRLRNFSQRLQDLILSPNPPPPIEQPVLRPSEDSQIDSVSISPPSAQLSTSPTPIVFPRKKLPPVPQSNNEKKL